MAATPPPLNGPRGPVTPPGVWNPIQINSHLHTLKILFYVLGAIQLCIGIVLLPVAFAGYAAESNSMDPGAQPMLLIVLLLTASLVFACVGALSFVAAKALGQRQRHSLCLIAAGASCLAGALGIALGVYAFIVLLKPEVKSAFAPPGSTVVA